MQGMLSCRPATEPMRVLQTKKNHSSRKFAGQRRTCSTYVGLVRCKWVRTVSQESRVPMPATSGNQTKTYQVDATKVKTVQKRPWRTRRKPTKVASRRSKNHHRRQWSRRSKNHHRKTTIAGNQVETNTYQVDGPKTNQSRTNTTMIQSRKSTVEKRMNTTMIQRYLLLLYLSIVIRLFCLLPQLFY